MDDVVLPAILGDDGPILPVPPVDEQSCSLLGPVALVVQAIMAILVISSLLVKRYREHPRRQWTVWLGDVSKQVIGQAFLHATNILVSTLFSRHSEENACTAYFVSIFVDCTLGVLVIYAAMKVLSHIAIKSMGVQGCTSGQYYEKQTYERRRGHRREDSRTTYKSSTTSPDERPDDIEEGQNTSIDSIAPLSFSDFMLSWWAKQLLIYVLALCVMKCIVIVFFWIPQVFDAGDWLLRWFDEKSRIVFVLMIFPLIMNAFQFLLIDTILKSKQALLDATADSGFGEPAQGDHDADPTGRQGMYEHLRHDESDDDEDITGRQGEHRAFLSSNSKQERRKEADPELGASGSAMTNHSNLYKSARDAATTKSGSTSVRSTATTSTLIPSRSPSSSRANSPILRAASPGPEEQVLRSRSHLAPFDTQSVDVDEKGSIMDIGTTTSIAQVPVLTSSVVLVDDSQHKSDGTLSVEDGDGSASSGSNGWEWLDDDRDAHAPSIRLSSVNKRSPHVSLSSARV